MAAVAALLLVWLILSTPVTLQLDVRYIHELEGVLCPRIWGLGPTVRFRLMRTKQGHRFVRLDASGQPKLPAKTARFAFNRSSALLRSVLRRKTLFRGIDLERLDIVIRVGFENAARTALVTGALQSLWRSLPRAWREKARFQASPDFLSGGGAALRCMVFFHLGTLIFKVAALLAMEALRRMREE